MFFNCVWHETWPSCVLCIGLTETVEVEMIHTGVNEPQQQSSFILHVTAVAAAATMTVKHTI